jgi:hypothetical protein
MRGRGAGGEKRKGETFRIDEIFEDRVTEGKRRGLHESAELFAGKEQREEEGGEGKKEC